MLRTEEQAYEAQAVGTSDPPTVIRTGRGLTIAGTRITLYQILDYLKAGWSPDQIQYLHRLTDAQIVGILAYIEDHRAEVDAEYEIVLRRADEIRSYWEKQDRARQAQNGVSRDQPGREELRTKLEAWKKRLSRRP